VCIAEKDNERKTTRKRERERERERKKKYLLGIQKKGDLDFFCIFVIEKEVAMKKIH
jgi:hypothetical protein